MTDLDIISRHERYAISGTRYEVPLRDGSCVVLHPVFVDGVPATFLRALDLWGMQWMVFDVRRLLPKLDEDIRRLPARDAQGVVLYELRQAFQHRSTLQQQILAIHDDAWNIHPPTVAVRPAAAAASAAQKAVAA